MRKLALKFTYFACMLCAGTTFAATTQYVTTSADSGAGSLRSAIAATNSNGGGTIIICQATSSGSCTNSSAISSITLTSANLPVITQPVTICYSSSSTACVNPGSQSTISGGNAYRLFATYKAALTLQNLIISGGQALGGAGGAGSSYSGAGGGGLGAGGAIYADLDQSITISNVTIQSCKAQGGGGGAGGPPSGSTQNAGGGGGASWTMGTNLSGGTLSTQTGGGDYPGSSTTSSSTFYSSTTEGVSSYGGGAGGAPGGSPTSNAAAGAISGNTGANGGYAGGGGGSGGSSGGSGGGGGNPGSIGGGTSGIAYGGGGGGYGSGGGGSTNADVTNNLGGGGGGGGFGGGGGGAAGGSNSGGAGGGGYGGGGGGGSAGGGGAGNGAGGLFGGAGGGDNFSEGGAGGGGGGALGGGIFVGDGANLYWGDSITMAAGSVGTCTGTANCVTAGTGGAGNSGAGNGANGTAYATDIFLFQNSALTFNGSASSQTINAAIQADQNTPSSPPIILDRGIVVALGSATSTIVLNSANNSYRGGTTLTQGILSISSDSNLGTAPTSAITNITFNGGTLANTSNVALNANRTILANAAATFVPASGTTLTITANGQLTNANNAGITINGNGGTLLVSGTNTAYTGTTTITAGTLSLGANTAINNKALIMNGGIFTTNANGLSLTSAYTVTANSTFGGVNTYTMSGNGALSAGTLTVVPASSQTITLSGALSGAGNLAVNGSGGTLGLANTSNTYTGTTTITAGTLLPTVSNAMSVNSAVSIGASGTLNLNSTNQSISSLSGISGGAISLGANTLTINQATSAIYAGSISGAGGLTVGSNDASVLTLNGNGSAYTGTTIINSNAVIAIGSNNTLGAALTMNGGTLEASTPLSAAVTTPYTLTANSTFGGSNNFIMGGAGNLGTSTLNITNTANSIITLSGGISATAGSISINGDGTNTLSLAGTNVYTGTTYITAGTLSAATAKAFSPNSAVVLANSALASMVTNGHQQIIGSLSGGGSAGGNIINSGTLQINQTANGIYAGAISTGGEIALTSASTATLTLTNANPDLNNAIFLIAGGTLAIATNTSLGTGASSSLYMDGGAFQVSTPLAGAITNQFIVAANSTFNGSTSFTISGNGNLGLGGNYFLTAGSTSGATITLSGALVGTGGIVVDGDGTNILALSNTNNTYSGTTIITAGTLAAGAANAFSVNSAVNLNGATGVLNLNNFSQSIGSLSGISGSSISLGTGTLSINQTANGIFAGSIAGTGGVTLNGNSGIALTLGGTNTYSGTTTINSGILSANANNAFSANSAISIAANGTLSLNNTNQSSSSLSGVTGSVISLGTGTLTVNQATAAAYAGTISGSGELIVASSNSSVLTLSGNNSAYAGTIAIDSNAIIAVSTNNALGAALVMAGGTLQASTDLSATPITTPYSLTANSTFSGANSFTMSGNGALAASALTITPSAANTAITLSGALSGTSASNIIMNGPGILALNGTNSAFAGTTILSAGILSINNNTALGTNINANALTLSGGTFEASVNIPAASPILTPYTLTANTTFTGFSFNMGGAGTLNSNILTVMPASSGTTITLSGAINGSGSSGILMDGSGTLALSGENSAYAGTTTVTSGTLSVGNNAALGINTNATALTIGGSTLIASTPLTDAITTPFTLTGNTTFGGTNSFNMSGAGYLGNNTLNVTNTATTTLGGALTDGGTGSPGALTLNANGSTLILSGTGSTYHGATTITAGTIQTNVNNAMSANSAVIIAAAANAVLNLNNTNQVIGTLSGGATSSNNITLGSGNLSVKQTGTTAFIGNITGTGSFALTSASTGSLTLNGTNTYSGGTTISAGTLVMGSAFAVPSNASLTLNPTSPTTGTLNMNSNSLSVTNLSGTSTATIALGSNAATTLTVNPTTANTYAGTISGTGNLAYAGSNTDTLTLSGSNSYSGTTTITAGNLIITNNAAIPAGGAIDIATTSSTFTPNVDFTNSGTITNDGNIAGSNTITNTGTIIFANSATSSANIISNGTLTINSSSADYANITGSITSSGIIAGSGYLTSNNAITFAGGSNSANITSTATGNITVSADTDNIGTITNQGQMTVNTNVSLTGNGTLYNTGASGDLILNDGAVVTNEIFNYPNAAIEVLGNATVGVVAGLSSTAAGTVNLGANGALSATSFTNPGITNVSVTNDTNGSITSSGIVDLDHSTLNVASTATTGNTWVIATGSAVSAAYFTFLHPPNGTWSYELMPTGSPTELIITLVTSSFITVTSGGLYIIKVANVIDEISAAANNPGQVELVNYFINTTSTQELDLALQQMLANINVDNTVNMLFGAVLDQIQPRAAAANRTKKKDGYMAGDINDNLSFWIGGIGNIAKQNQSSEGINTGYRVRSAGALLGFDLRTYDRDLVLGVAFGTTNANTHEMSNYDFKAHTLSFYFLQYGSFAHKDVFVEWVAGAATNKNACSRNINITGNNLSVNSSYRSAIYGGKGNVGKFWDINMLRFSELLSVQYSLLNQPQYNESGSVAALQVTPSPMQSLLTTGAGMRLGLARDTWIHGLNELRAEISYDCIQPSRTTVMNFIVGSPDFAMINAPQARLALTLGADLTIPVTKKLQLQFSYEYQRRSNFYDNVGEVKVRYVF